MDQLLQLKIHQTEILLKHAEGVWTPSPNGLFYAESITIHAGERVLDIGTGSGVLAIMAALRGAQVEATDTDPRALQAADANARLNQVNLQFHAGSLFASAQGAFDVIMANLPNEIVAPAELSLLNPEDARVFEGGQGGNEFILQLLQQAPAHMHGQSRLYLPIHTLTNYHQTLEYALHHYQLHLLSLQALPVKSFVSQNLNFYLPLNDRGLIHIFNKEPFGWHSYGYIYEARLK